jgi:MFS family permease
MFTENEVYEKRLEQNIIKYSWFKVFTKRVYLPLIVIQLVNVGGVTVKEIALITIITSVVQTLLQLPTGYIADKFGNKFAILFGAAITTVSPLFYIFMPSFTGGLLASLLFFGGFTFQSGAIEAFIHDTLVALRRENDYSKIMGKAQSYGLIGNIVLISLVPATYAINHNLPFIIGFISLLIMLWLAISFTYPVSHRNKETNNPLNAITKIMSWKNFTIFIFAGFATGVSNKSMEYQALLLENIGIAVALLGFLYALSSILGAFFGNYIHVLDKLKPIRFYIFDIVLMSSCLILIGFTTNPFLVIVGFTIFAGYGRVRQIIFQSKLLTEMKHTYKATLISALNLFTVVGDMIAITLLAKMIGLKGYSTGYFLFGIVIFGIGILLWLILLLGQRNPSNKGI